MCIGLKKTVKFQKGKPGWKWTIYMFNERRRKTLQKLSCWDRMWNWECESAAEQYQYICVRYCDWIGWEGREEKRQTWIAERVINKG